MESLDKDRDFLTQGNVFTDDQIDAYIALKFEEIHKFEHAPHPVEFEMYYSSWFSYCLVVATVSLLTPFLTT